jgi:hypothetical protein
MKVAALIHLLDWCSKDKEHAMMPGVRILEMESTPIKNLYIQSCLKKGLDDGDPFDYKTAIELDYEVLGFHADDFFDPYSLGSRIINVLIIYFGTPLGVVRTLYSDDDFKSLKFTSEHFLYTTQQEFIIKHHSCISESNIATINIMLENTLNVWNDQLSSSRVINALTYFFYSWNAHYLEQTAINISVSLECLFSPPGSTELTHQIAMNIANFASDERGKKEEVYKQFKKFYAVRSKVVHGEMPNDRDFDLIPIAFRETSKIILRILIDKEMTKMFNNNELRRAYFNDLLFGSSSKTNI